MKSLILAAGVATLAVAGTANAAVLSVGGPLSQNCYEAALAHQSRTSAIEGCTRALTEEGLLDRDRAATFVNRGIVQMAAGRLSAADDDFDQALTINAALSDAWLNKGFLRIREGKGQEALPMLQKGIDNGPRREALAYFARGVAHEQSGDYRSAYADLVKARAMEPQWALPAEWLGHYRVQQ
ncbi:MAG TPA: tetratricopeptide repeat protein [Sphingomicrobium sp.]|nr:tetratricopeptide repeat protein [Sphingomicrobium sp.]